MTDAQREIISLLQQIKAAAGGGGAVNWGDIQGALSNQTDLQTELNLKQTAAQVASAIAASGGKLLETSGAPDNGDGANGDWSFDNATKTIYGPKAAGVWPAGVVLGGSAADFTTLFSHYNDVSNALTDGTSETLRSDTIPADTLTVNGEKIVQVETLLITGNLGGTMSIVKQFGNRDLWVGTVASPLTDNVYLKVTTTIYRTGGDSFRSFVDIQVNDDNGSGVTISGMAVSGFLERSGAWPNDWTGTHVLAIIVSNNGGAAGEITHRLSTTTKQK